MPSDAARPTRLVDRSGHAGARCVTVLGAGPAALELVERLVDAQHRIDANPLIVHVIHPEPVVEGRERLEAAADRAVAGTRILHHRAEAIGIEDARNGAQLVHLASGDQMTTDGVVVVLDAPPGDDEPGAALLAGLVEAGAARPAEVPIDAADGRMLRPDGLPHSRRFAAGGLARGAEAQAPPLEPLVRALLKLVRRLRPAADSPFGAVPAPIAGFDGAALYSPGPGEVGAADDRQRARRGARSGARRDESGRP